MTREPLTVTPDTPADAAALVMIEHDVRHLPVVKGRRPIGMISARDLLSMSAWPLLLEIAERADDPSGRAETGLMALLTYRCGPDAVAGGEQ